MPEIETNAAEVAENAQKPIESSPSPDSPEAPPEPELVGFDLCEKISAGLSEKEGFAEELRKNVQLPDAEKLKDYFKEAGFSQNQIKLVEELTETVAKTAGLASDSIKRAQQEAMKNSFQDTLKQEYGKSGMQQAEKAVLSWCEKHGLKSDILAYLSPEEQVSLTQNIFKSGNAEKVREQFAKQPQTSSAFDNIVRLRGLN